MTETKNEILYRMEEEDTKEQVRAKLKEIGVINN
jgi:hypothetical protein